MGLLPPLPPRLPWPPPPPELVARITGDATTGRLPLGLFCRAEAERELEAFLRGEDYEFRLPEIEPDGHVSVPPR